MGAAHVFGEGVSPGRAEEFAARHRLVTDNTDHDEGADETGKVVVLVADVDDHKLAAAAAHGYHACCEVARNDEHDEDSGVAEELLQVLSEGGLYLSLTTRAAYHTNVARHVCRRVGSEFGLAMTELVDMEHAVHEAIANVVLHANLEIPPSMPETMEELATFSRLVQKHLNDSVMAARRIRVVAHRLEKVVAVTVCPERAAVPESGPSLGLVPTRGMAVVYDLASAVTVFDHNHCITMEFGR